MEQLQSHVWLTASSPHYMGKYLRISWNIRKPFLIYDFATAPLRLSLCMRKIRFSFFSVCAASSATPSCAAICTYIVIIYYFSRHVIFFLRHMLNLSIWQLVLLLERNITAEDWTRIDQIGIQGPYLYISRMFSRQDCIVKGIFKWERSGF
jgi:hypothetical protein